MPWNRAGVTESPFVTVFRSVNFPGAAHFMNFVVLTAALSGANAALYISSRMLFSLARTGWAPPALGRLSTKGTPTLALLVSSYGIIVALVLERWAPAKAFEYILRGAFFGMMLSWIIFAGRPHQLPPPAHRRPGCRNSRPLTAGQMGIHRRPSGSPGSDRQNLVGFPHQPDRRTNFPDRPDRPLLPPPPKREAEQLLEAAENSALSNQTLVGQLDS